MSDTPRWLLFQGPTDVITANRPAGVTDCLRQVEIESARGLYAAGFVTYEASPAMDPAFEVRPAHGLPLIWFGLYERCEDITMSAVEKQAVYLSGWQPSAPLSEYRESISEIKRRIAAGDTYQVNFTFRLRSAFRGNPWDMFLMIGGAQGCSYSAYINLTEWTERER